MSAVWVTCRGTTTRSAEPPRRRPVVVLGVTAPHLSTAQAPFNAPGPTYTGPSATPLYDALVDEYRLAFRAVPGERGPEEDLAATRMVPQAQAYGFVPAARRPPVDSPRQASRHRRAPGEMPAYY